MPINKEDYVSEGGKVAFDPYFKPEKVEGVKFIPGESGTPNNVGKEVPASALASDQADFTGPEILFSKNANNFSEDKGLPYNQGDDTGV